ncbi:P63C domain-containing protein [Argonema galeatum]|uniref:P63C domain-containing protein n=1 Tax=Argonema galeatum TaxID=2942762 RepID=UPI0020111D65|nr:P63C domain-containing protein [Argonema galeatum]MCL1465949.1 P63C domain-containing protein [Argonema galeatum A003/A1]
MTNRKSSIIKTTREGIEFYTHEATGESGMSQSGLARLCDVAQQTINVLLQDLATGQARSECLEPFAGKDLWLKERGLDQAKVVKDEICAAIIEYYAFEARKTTEKALFAYRKFAKMGVRAWIQEITGWENRRKVRIIQAFLQEKHDPWKPRFEKEFFDEAYRVTGWKSTSKGHPSVMGKLINKTIYDWFPDGVVERLEELNPRQKNGLRKRKQFQYLKEPGLKFLDGRRLAVLAVMRLSPDSDRKQFETNIEKAFSGTTQEIYLSTSGDSYDDDQFPS